MNILLGMTGSVASGLAPKLVNELLKLGNVTLVPTENARRFYSAPQMEAMSLSSQGRFRIVQDKDEWDWKKKGDPIQHIELGKWADILVVAPLSANTLAKIANGLCDNLLTSILRAWDYNKPTVFAAAMNTKMYHHPLTQEQIGKVKSFDRKLWRTTVFVEPQNKVLACGDEGKGAMADIKDIVKVMSGSGAAVQWVWPLYHSNGLPYGDHPGAFGARRKFDMHTGVDLYNFGGSVRAVESGTIVKIIPFTGSKVMVQGKPSTWWKDTKAVIIKGVSGYVCYGEIEPEEGLKEGSFVVKGEHVGHIVQVLPDGKKRHDIPGHSCHMLHIELYSELYSENGRGIWEGWELDSPKPDKLLDPTDKLGACKPSSVPYLTIKERE